jgi:hypothetical protein
VPTKRSPLQATNFLKRPSTVALTGLIVTGTLALSVLQAGATAGQILKLRTSDGGSTFYVGRCFRTDIAVQTDTLNANSVDVIIPYSSTYVQPYTGSGCTTPATAINTNNLFLSYPGNSIAGDKIQVTAYDPTGTTPVNTGAAPTDRVLGHIFWKVLAASGSFNMRFDYTAGSTTDTNMAQQNGDGSDVLDSVQNLSLTLADDDDNPTFTNKSPSAGATGVSVTTGISYTFNDAKSGVNSATLTTKLSGTTKALTISGCGLTNSNRVPSCNASVNSVGTLSYATLYTVSATGSDVASPSTHQGSTFWQFTTEDDTNAPYIQNLSPSGSQVGVPVNTNIVFHVKDYKNQAGVTPGLGVNIASVQVTVTPVGGSPVVYNYTSPGFTYSGTSADYTVTIDPSQNFAQNTVVGVAIEAADMHSPPNTMSTYSYSFTTSDTTAPSISSFQPAQGATGVDPATNIYFHVADDGAGIDIANTSVVIAGTTYTSSNPRFSYTGTPADYAITIDPTSNFSGGQVVSVSIATRDLASTPNTGTASYNFTINNACTTCSVDTEDPARFSTAATLDNTISFHVKDTGNGILQSSIRMTLIGTGSAMPLSPLVLTGASSQVAITGTSGDYTVVITLPASIQEGIAYSILIEATDVNSVPMQHVGYTFMKASSSGGGACPVCETCPTCPATSCPTTSDGGAKTTGGHNPYIQQRIDSIPSAQLPIILVRRRLPGSDTIVATQLTEEQAQSVNRCYVDESDLHGAAPNAKTNFLDVPAGSWFEDAVRWFLDHGILDSTPQNFRPGDSAVRAELAKILTKMKFETPPALPDRLSFDDIQPNDWFAPFVQAAADNGWMKGYNNCIGSHPCFVRPASTISRGEAAAMMVRYLSLVPTKAAPDFSDVQSDAWYKDVLQAAADHCIVQGDPKEHLANPDALLTRAEMVVMLERARRGLSYGLDCSWDNQHK